MARIDELRNERRADETRRSRNKDTHILSPPGPFDTQQS
jgi:hypothetical protein